MTAPPAEAGPTWQKGGCGRALGARMPGVARPPSSFVWLASGWAWAAVLGWGWTVSALVGLSLLFLLCAFQKSAFLTCFTCFRLCFCIHINSTGTSGNRSEAHVYVCINVYFPPFWAYVGGKNLSLTTSNKLPQAYPLLVLEQKLRCWLLIRSCYYADYISKVPCL